MVDKPPATTTPPIPEIDKNLIPDFSSLSNVVDAARGAFEGFASASSGLSDVFNTLDQHMKAVGISLNSTQQLTAAQTRTFGLLSAAVLGARDSFQDLSGVDFSNLDTFSAQWKEMQQAIEDSPFLKTAKERMEASAQAAIKMGAPFREVAVVMKRGSEAVKEYAAAFFKSADNGLKLEHANLQLFASTGQLSKIYEAAGDHLENINVITGQYDAQIRKAAEATGIHNPQVEKYYSILGQVPGALDANVRGGKGVNETVSMLTATMQYAAGSGRKFEDITKDLTAAFKSYNLTGEDALQFTAQIGELANKFGVPLSDMENSLIATADAFKMYGNEAKGAAAIMNQYLGALESTGLSGSAAVDVVNNMTAGIGKLSIAQKSFISSQTGGAGGLMGGFQIEKLMREGHMDQVMDKVKSTLTRQFGQIRTLQEASTNPQAAAQFEKQILMLRQGPLGSLAKDDQSAMRLLEAMKSGQTKIPTDLSKNPAQDMMAKGVEIQKESRDIQREMLQKMESARGVANTANLNTAQSLFTAGTGEEDQTEEQSMSPEAWQATKAMRGGLTGSMEKSAWQSGEVTKNLREQMAAKQLHSQTGAFAVQAIHGGQDLMGNIGSTARAAFARGKSMFETENKAKDTEQAQQSAGAGLPEIPVKPNLLSGRIDPSRGGLFTPSQRVGAAAGASARTGSATTATGAPPNIPAHPNQTQSNTVSGEITVHVVVSDELGNKIQDHSQRLAVLTASR